MPFAPFNNNSPSCVILILSSAVTDLPNKTLIFHDFQGPTIIIKFHDFPGLENEILKFHDFPGFPWPVQTWLYTIIDSTYTTRKYCYCCKMLHCSFNLNSNRDSQIQHFFTFGLVQGIFLSQNESFITYQVWSLRKKKMAAMALDNPSSDSFQSTLILLQCSCLPCYSKTKRFLGPTGRNATHQIWIELFLGSCICSEWKCCDGFTNNFFDFLLNFRTINLTVLRYKSQTTIQWVNHLEDWSTWLCTILFSSVMDISPSPYLASLPK